MRVFIYTWYDHIFLWPEAFDILWEYMNSSHAHLLKWHFKGRLGPRRHRSLGNLWGHQVASKAADSESCLDWTREAAKMRIPYNRNQHDMWRLRSFQTFWIILIFSNEFFKYLSWSAKMLVWFANWERLGYQTCWSCCGPYIYNSAGDPYVLW